MPNSDTDISSSGKVAAHNIRVSDKFTDFAELPSKGHCRLMKAQRYGMWNVLKGLKPQYTADKQYVQMLTKEYSLMVGLNHPNIVRTYGHENVPGLGECIIMEYVDGRTLADFVREKPTAALCRQVAEELLDALAYCHKKQIVHQDLKPSNILITHDGDHVRIIDFGLSDSHEWAILKEPAYTKAYAAPEQLAGEEVDNRTDIYAFGIILRQMFPNRYGCVVRKCLQPQREKRYSSADAVLCDIKRADSRRKRMPVVASLLVILVGLAIFIGRQFSLKEDVPVTNTETLADEQNATDLFQDTAQEFMGNDIAEDLQDSQIEPIATKNSTDDFLQQQTSPSFIKTLSEEFQSQQANQSDNEEPALSEIPFTNYDQYLAIIDAEIDSIMEPFNKEVRDSTILYMERYSAHSCIVHTKILIHAQKRRQQLPYNNQDVLIRHVVERAKMIEKYFKQEMEKYPSFSVLYSQGKISYEEWSRLYEEYLSDSKEFERLLDVFEEERKK